MSVSLSTIFNSLLAMCLILFPLAGCSHPPVSQAEVLVAAAADLTRALPELARDFEKRNGVKVVPTFGPSGSLAQQIANGAPVDVFLSADQRFVTQLVDAHQADGASRRVYARGRLVLYAPSMRLDDIGALRAPSVKRIAIANPEIAPYGRAAKQALERAKIWDEVRGKVVFAENVRQAMEMANSGNAEAALTALSLAPDVKTIVPESLYDPIRQEGVLVSRANANPHAKAFLDYLGTPPGLAILERYGFVRD
jgi:molybdate transport system substrate-binding protein